MAYVARREQVEAAVAAIAGEQERIDVLVNAAGSSGESVKTDMPLAEAAQAWDGTLATNLTGAFLICAAVAPHLRRPGGHIILLSSIAAFTGGSRAGTVAYAAAKASVLGMTYGFARELSPQGITVNAIAPGLVTDTGCFGGALSEERLHGIVAQTPAGRPGHPEDIAAAALYLASPAASFVTGEVLNVNGGWLFGH